MTAIVTENVLINGDNKVLLTVPSESTKKRLYFSTIVTNFSTYDAELWLAGVGFGVTPNVLANAVYIPSNDYLPNRSQWKYPHKLALPPGGSIWGYVRIKTTEADWHTLEDFHAVESETWDNPGYYHPVDDIVNLSLTYAEVK